MIPILKDMTDFIFLEDIPEKSDIIFIPGSGYGALSLTAAKLWHQGFAPYILPSGRFSILDEKFTGSMDGVLPSGTVFPNPMDKVLPSGTAFPNPMDEVLPSAAASSNTCLFATESDYHKAILRDQGVPEDAILLENQATYTYENAIYSKKLTDDLGMHIHKAIICCQAFHARRCLLYYELLYPETRFYICPTVTQNISRDNWYLEDSKIDRVLGEIERCGSQFHQILRQIKPSD